MLFKNPSICLLSLSNWIKVLNMSPLIFFLVALLSKMFYAPQQKVTSVHCSGKSVFIIMLCVALVARWSDKMQHDRLKHFCFFLVLSFYPLILCLMKNCTCWSSELSRFRGNNYHTGDLCFFSPADKYPVPWGIWSENDTVLNWLNFIVSHPPSSSLPLRFYFTKVWTQFFVDGGKKGKEGNNKEYERPIFTEH